MRIGSQPLDESLIEDTYPELDFETQWDDPLTSEHTDLDRVPNEAIIEMANGLKRRSTMAFIIKRAMIDPNATVVPDDGQ